MTGCRPSAWAATSAPTPGGRFSGSFTRVASSTWISPATAPGRSPRTDARFCGGRPRCSSGAKRLWSAGTSGAAAPRRPPAGNGQPLSGADAGLLEALKKVRRTLASREKCPRLCRVPRQDAARHGAPQAANAGPDGDGPWRGRRQARTVWRGVSCGRYQAHAGRCTGLELEAREDRPPAHSKSPRLLPPKTPSPQPSLQGERER